MRTLAMPKTAALTSLREKLIKIGAKIVNHGRYVTFQMAEVAVPRQMFQEILFIVAHLTADRENRDPDRYEYVTKAVAQAAADGAIFEAIFNQLYPPAKRALAGGRECARNRDRQQPRDSSARGRGLVDQSEFSLACAARSTAARRRQRCRKRTPSGARDRRMGRFGTSTPAAKCASKRIIARRGSIMDRRARR